MAVNLWLLTLLKKFHGGDLLSILQHSSTPEACFPVLTAQIVIYTTRRCWTHRRASRPTLSPGQTDSQVNASWKLAFNFRFLWPFTLWSCTDFRRLPLTLVEFKFVRKSTQVFHHLATQHKSLRKFWFCKFALTCESVYPGCQRFSKRRAATRREERLVNRFSWDIVAWVRFGIAHNQRFALTVSFSLLSRGERKPLGPGWSLFGQGFSELS